MGHKIVSDVHVIHSEDLRIYNNEKKKTKSYGVNINKVLVIDNFKYQWYCWF